MEIKKRLVMNFKTLLGKKVSISVDNPKEDLSEEDIKDAMNTILSKNIFTANGDDFATAVDARIVETGTTEFDLVL